MKRLRPVMAQRFFIRAISGAAARPRPVIASSSLAPFATLYFAERQYHKTSKPGEHESHQTSTATNAPILVPKSSEEEPTSTTPGLMPRTSKTLIAPEPNDIQQPYAVFVVYLEDNGCNVGQLRTKLDIIEVVDCVLGTGWNQAPVDRAAVWDSPLFPVAHLLLLRTSEADMTRIAEEIEKLSYVRVVAKCVPQDLGIPEFLPVTR